MHFTSFRSSFASLSLVMALLFSSVLLAGADSLRLAVQARYLPGVPVLVRVEKLDSRGEYDRNLWDADATLAVNPAGVLLSSNKVHLRNGMGSTLVSFTNGGDVDLTVTLGALSATRTLVTATNLPVSTNGGTLTASNTVWSGVIRVTNDVTIPTGYTLTILSNTLVLIDGVTSGTSANDFLVNGQMNCLGTEDQPVVITCGNPSLSYRWGQMRYEGGSLATAPLCTYRYTTVTRAGRAPGEGHTGTGPIIRPHNARLLFEHCSLTDHIENVPRANGAYGTPGKIGFADTAELTFNDCLLQRARTGPEIQGTALLVTNSFIMDMLGPDDSDGIYIHAPGAGQTCAVKYSVLAVGDDDGIDTLDPVVTVEDCIIRDWSNLLEDAKGISVFNGATTVKRSLIVDCTVGISAKTTSSVRVNISESTLTRNNTNVLAQKKSTAPGPIVDYRITNSILWGVSDSVQSDFAPTNFTIGFCNLSEPWPGTNNLVSDPLFANAAAHDFHLLPYSPSIDSGNPQSPNDPDGSRIDQGCFTFQPGPPLLSQPMLLGGMHQFTLNAYSNRNYVVESSDILPAWTFLKTVFQTNETGLVLDATATNAPYRFYRARLAP